MKNNYEAIVVGAGHAGIEAAFALANKNHKVALFSFNINKVAMMPCNPSIGGPAKGILTKEIDALGGMQGFFADKAMIQIKMLNESRGPAVRALRAQIDKDKYSQIIKEEILKNKYIDFIEGIVKELIIKDNKIIGVKLNNQIYSSKVTIITTGTYMNSYVLRGETKKNEGPDGQQTSSGISNDLKKIGLKMQRLKTGTPPRIYANSIDFDKVEKEFIPNYSFNFSNRSNISLKKQVYCYLTYTNKDTHEIIKKNLNKSSMYSGAINGIGPRYCPSIEDKIVRFADKERHQLFYEPETLKGDVIYLQGLSTSMPISVQKEIIKTLPGMANAKVKKWAYAIEYDAIDPLQLQPTLELKKIKNLFLAGQINGTSGYEEAASQGLIAGINASLKLEKKQQLILSRDKAYIGVLIDDLTTKGTNEPYRMLTSRAEYRLLLRNDNADQRLSKIGFELGLISEKNYKYIVNKYKSIKLEIERLKNTYLSTNDPLAKKYNIKNSLSFIQFLSRPGIDINEVSNFEFINELVVHIRLEGYVKKQKKEAKKILKLDNFKIPKDINYDKVLNLATEARQKLKNIRPITIGQANRISGINPADIQMLMFYIEYRFRKNEN